jgi:hypothetical protein
MALVLKQEALDMGAGYFGDPDAPLSQRLWTLVDHSRLAVEDWRVAKAQQFTEVLAPQAVDAATEFNGGDVALA